MQLLRGACHPDVEARAILEMTPLREASDRARCANTDSERRSVTDAFGQEVRQIYARLMGAPTCVVIYMCGCRRRAVAHCSVDYAHRPHKFSRE